MSLPKLSCSSIVYRAVLRSSLIHKDDGRVTAGTFLRRPGRDEKGLSVSIECTPSECAEGFQPCHAVLSLHVGFIRDLGLSVEPDQPDHAHIVGLPYETDRDREGRHKAGLLARHGRYVLRPERRSARRIWDYFRENLGSEPTQLWNVFDGSAADQSEFWQAKLEDGRVERVPVTDVALR